MEKQQRPYEEEVRFTGTAKELLKVLEAWSSCKTCNSARHRECHGKFPILQEMFEKMCFSILPSIRHDVIHKIRAFRDEFQYEGSYTINMYVGQVHQELDDLIDLIIMAIPNAKPAGEEENENCEDEDCRCKTDKEV